RVIVPSRISKRISIVLISFYALTQNAESCLQESTGLRFFASNARAHGGNECKNQNLQEASRPTNPRKRRKTIAINAPPATTTKRRSIHGWSVAASAEPKACPTTIRVRNSIL